VFSIGVMYQPGMVLAQRLHLAQLLQSLLLLDIVPTGVGIGGDCLCKPLLEGAVGVSELRLDVGLETAIEVRSKEMERGFAHACIRVSAGTNADVM
jgi:hypothetical protein